MSAEIKKPQEFGPVPPYKAHFELWDEAAADLAIDDADAPPIGNGRRMWTTPVLTTTPFVAPRPRNLPEPVTPPLYQDYLTMGAFAIGALLAIIAFRPSAHRPMRVATRPAARVHFSPKARP